MIEVIVDIADISKKRPKMALGILGNVILFLFKIVSITKGIGSKAKINTDIYLPFGNPNPSITKEEQSNT